jgi:hypothetical protein
VCEAYSCVAVLNLAQALVRLPHARLHLVPVAGYERQTFDASSGEQLDVRRYVR